MSGASDWKYGGGATGQPAPLAEGEFTTARLRPELFGQQARLQRGVPRVIQFPRPANGTEVIYAHSGPSWLLFRCMVVQLNCSAAAANRAFRMQIFQNGILCGQFPAQAVAIANSFTVYSISEAGVSTGDALTVCVPVPFDLIIKDGTTWQTSTVNLQGGDNYTPQAMLVEEFTDRCLDVY